EDVHGPIGADEKRALKNTEEVDAFRQSASCKGSQDRTARGSGTNHKEMGTRLALQEGRHGLRQEGEVLLWGEAPDMPDDEGPLRNVCGGAETRAAAAGKALQLHARGDDLDGHGHSA